MDAISAWAETYADRHHRLLEALYRGTIADPERLLFLELLRELPPPLNETPLLYDASWGGGRFDLLLTDAEGTRWCAVEVKEAPAIVGSGRSRKNCKTTSKRRREKLAFQTRLAARVASAHIGRAVTGLGLWHQGDAWVVVERYDAAQSPTSFGSGAQLVQPSGTQPSENS